MGVIDIWVYRSAVVFLGIVAVAGTSFVGYLGVLKEDVPPALGTLTGCAITALVFIAQAAAGANGAPPKQH